MSLRKRLSFKRVWNFNTVSSMHTHTHKLTSGLSVHSFFFFFIGEDSVWKEMCP